MTSAGAAVLPRNLSHHRRRRGYSHLFLSIPSRIDGHCIVPQDKKEPSHTKIISAALQSDHDYCIRKVCKL